MNSPRRLGRGLEALLGQPFGAAEGVENVEGQPAPQLAAIPTVEMNGLTYINVYEVDTNPFQPRRDFDEAEIEALAQSIRDHGLLQPIVVRRINDRFQLIAGERRLRGAIKAGWAQVPAQVREADDRQVAEIAIVENLQRKDLNALEKAASFQQYLSTYGCTQEELAARLSFDRSTIANLIRLLELPDAVQQAVARGTISAGHARALLPLGNESQQIELLRTNRKRRAERPRHRATGARNRRTARRTEPIGRRRRRRIAPRPPPLPQPATGRAGTGTQRRPGHESATQPNGKRPRQNRHSLFQSRRIRSPSRAAYAFVNAAIASGLEVEFLQILPRRYGDAEPATTDLRTSTFCLFRASCLFRISIFGFRISPGVQQCTSE